MGKNREDRVMHSLLYSWGVSSRLFYILYPFSGTDFRLSRVKSSNDSLCELSINLIGLNVPFLELIHYVRTFCTSLKLNP